MTFLKLWMKTFIGFTLMAALFACAEGPSSENLNDMSLGSPEAPYELIEYASATCPACAALHSETWETVKTLTDDGKLHYIFREFPRNEIDVAAFVLARCAGNTRYFAVLDDLFKNQTGILNATRNGSVRSALQTLAARHGVDGTQFETCLRDETLQADVTKASEAGRAAGVNATPTLFLNNRLLSGAEGRTAESLLTLIEGNPEG